MPIVRLFPLIISLQPLIAFPQSTAELMVAQHMKTVLPRLTSTTGRAARNLFFSSPPALVVLASTSLLQTSWCYTTLTGEFLWDRCFLGISNNGTGIRKQTFRPWIGHTASVKRSRCTYSGSSLRRAWKSECSSVARKSYAWIN